MNPIRQLAHVSFDADLATFREQLEAAGRHDAAMAQHPDVQAMIDRAARVQIAQQRERNRRRRV